MKIGFLNNWLLSRISIDRFRKRPSNRLQLSSTSLASRPLLPILSLTLLVFTALLQTGQSSIPSLSEYEHQLWRQKHADAPLLTQYHIQGQQSGNGQSNPDTFKKVNLPKCMTLTLLANESPTGRQLIRIHFNVRIAILPHFYKNKGPCRHIIHADSIEMFGQCYEMDIHVGSSEDFQRCKRRHPGTDHSSRLMYKRCVWNVRNVRTTATGPVPENAGIVQVGDNVVVKMYDKPRCSIPQDMGILVVKAEKNGGKRWRDLVQDAVQNSGRRNPFVPGGRLKPRLPRVPKLPKVPGLRKPRRPDRGRSASEN